MAVTEETVMKTARVILGEDKAEEGMEIYRNTSHVRGGLFKGTRGFFEFVKEWDATVARLKRSKVDLSKIPIVEKERSR